MGFERISRHEGLDGMISTTIRHQRPVLELLSQYGLISEHLFQDGLISDYDSNMGRSRAVQQQFGPYTRIPLNSKMPTRGALRGGPRARRGEQN